MTRAHRTTAERKGFVKKLASFMLKPDEISVLLKITSRTLYNRYRKEIDDGRAQARQKVEGVLYKRVTSSDKSMATANLQRWWMDRNFPVEAKDHGEQQRPFVTINLPDNGRSHPDFIAQNHALNQRRAPKLIEIEGRAV